MPSCYPHLTNILAQNVRQFHLCTTKIAPAIANLRKYKNQTSYRVRPLLIIPQNHGEASKVSIFYCSDVRRSFETKGLRRYTV